MRRSVLRWSAAVIVAALAIAGAWRWQGGRAVDPTLVAIGGGDGGGLPRAEPATEGFELQPLLRAEEWAVSQHADSLLVMRHGHLVVARLDGAGADSLVDGGELADTLALLAAGIAVAQEGMAMPSHGVAEAAGPADTLRPSDAAALSAAIAAAAHRSYPQFLSRYLWQPLNAAPAQWSPARVRARAFDWLRVAELLLHDGRFEGTQVVPPGWVRRLHQERAATGAEPFADQSMYFLRGRGGTRLWLSPRYELAVLCVADQAPALAADETRLPNMIVRALRDRPAGSGTSLDDLVPGH